MKKKWTPGCACCAEPATHHLHNMGDLFAKSTGIIKFDDVNDKDPTFDIQLPGTGGSSWLTWNDDIYAIGSAYLVRQSFAGENTLFQVSITPSQNYPDNSVLEKFGWAGSAGVGWAEGYEIDRGNYIYLYDTSLVVIADENTKTNRSWNLGANVVHNPGVPEWFTGNQFDAAQTSFCTHSPFKVGFARVGGNDDIEIWGDDLTIEDSGGGAWLYRLPTMQHSTPGATGWLDRPMLAMDYRESDGQWFWVAHAPLGVAAGSYQSYKLPWGSSDAQMSGANKYNRANPRCHVDPRGDVVAMYLESDTDRRLRFESADGNRGFNVAVNLEPLNNTALLMQSENWVYVWDIFTDDCSGLDFPAENTSWWRVNKNTYAVEGGRNVAVTWPLPWIAYPVQVNGQGY